MRQTHDAIREMLQGWEGEYSDHPKDRGNWWKGKLIGSTWGVTPAAYAKTTGKDPTVEQMKALPLEFAALLAHKTYFDTPGWNKLPWGPVVEALFDFGYNAGPKNSIMHMQALTGVAEDGSIGPITVKAFIEWVDDSGVKDALLQVLESRIGYYERVVARRPSNEIFIKGWINRASYYTTESTVWWNKWQESTTMA